jgi:hypothetical protein
MLNILQLMNGKTGTGWKIGWRLDVFIPVLQYSTTPIFKNILLIADR